MEDRVIEIFVDVTSHKLSYNYPIRHVDPGDRVQWICKSHDYAVQFASRHTPFDPPVFLLSKVKNKATDWCTIRGRKSVPEFCKYSVSVHIPGNDTPILTDDPIIIVDDEG